MSDTHQSTSSKRAGEAVKGLGCCYFPEHWPEDQWAKDAKAMREVGLNFVRMGEFAWSKIEPSNGQFEWEWLDKAINILAEEGLKVILCTPTATPPKWLIDRYPSILALDKHGAKRKFGSRRHYCFSSTAYARESARITKALAKRYGQNEAVIGWQTDNEYGCHDTVRSYSKDALRAFRKWLEDKYHTIESLNEAWGNAFWSMEYTRFEEIELPNQTVTEANPAHSLDFYRFSSDQVSKFNKAQCEILRELSPNRALIHNFMGAFTQFDHYELSKDLDIAAWDSYPLGFLDVFPFDEATKLKYAKTGHPDFTSFHHDLYRSMTTDERFMIMEQQPGPVNWAGHNPIPKKGMIRAWTHEAFAHGAEAVSYFRWRQLPFAQEQMHAGLERSIGLLSTGGIEAKKTARELANTPPIKRKRAKIALVFDYEASWVFEITPHGRSWNYFAQVLDWYGALRQLEQNVDVISQKHDISDYDLVVCPSLPIASDEFVSKVKSHQGQIVFGPRSGSKTAEFHNAHPNGPISEILPLKIEEVESLRPKLEEQVVIEGKSYRLSQWFDHVTSDLTPKLITQSGKGFHYESDGKHYLTSVADQNLLKRIFEKLLSLKSTEKGTESIRVTSLESGNFVINYGAEAAQKHDISIGPADIAYLR